MISGQTGKIRMPNNFDNHDDETFKSTLINAIEKARDVASKPVKFECKSKKLYFAGPWFDKRSEQLYNVCEKIINICYDFSKYDVFIPKNQQNKTPFNAFVKNVVNIMDADLVIALISRKDCGTSWEIGMAYALDKPVILLGYDDTTFLSHTNVMLAFTGKCATINSLAEILFDMDFEKVEIKDEWEGIE